MTGEEESTSTLNEDQRRVRIGAGSASLTTAIATTTPADQLSTTTAHKIVVAHRVVAEPRPKATAAAAAAIGVSRATLDAYLGRLA